jgi:outer membrane lipoprotein-sorting protein
LTVLALAVPLSSGLASAATTPAATTPAAAKPVVKAPAKPAAKAAVTAPAISAAQVVERAVAARGGAAAWRAVQTISWSGKMEAGGGNPPAIRAPGQPPPPPEGVEPKPQPQLPFRMELKRPHKSRLEIDFAGKTAVQVYDGKQGWKLRPFLNRNDVESYTPAELEIAGNEAPLDGALVDYAAKGTKIEFAGAEKVEGKDAYRLKLTLANGYTYHVWIDAQSFLEVKLEGTPRRLNGRLRSVSVYLRDYRTVQGLKVPYVIETAVEGFKRTEKIFIENVQVNPPLTDARFGKPG